MKLGVPRGLFYYQHYPLLRTFFGELGVETVVSPPTTREVMAAGCSRMVGETCLPVKVFSGHVLSLAGQCDAVLVPSIQSLEHKVYNCPKFIGLPDMVGARIPESPPVLDPEIDVDAGDRELYQAIYRLGRRFTWSPIRVKRAADAAMQAHQDYLHHMATEKLSAPQALHRMFPSREATRPEEGPPPAMTIALIGHPYVLYDEYISHQLAAKLRKVGARIVYPNMVAQDNLRSALLQVVERPYWTCEDEILGAGAYYLQQCEVSGVISVSPFGCGPDSLMLDLLGRYAKRTGKPYMQLVVDEHTAEAGLVTRLEAFLDTLSPRQATRPSPAYSGPLIRTEQAPRGIGALGIPNLGDKCVAFKSMAKDAGFTLLVPPVTRETLSLGVRYSPESACIPFKGILGNFIQALDEGADTLFMVTSFNACRMGYYSKVQEQILRDMGYKFQFLRFHSSDRGVPGVLRAIKRWSNGASWPKVISVFRLGVAKLQALDALEREVQSTRPVETVKGTADRLYREAIEAMDSAATMGAAKRVVQLYTEKLRQVPRTEGTHPLKVAIVGELYVVMVPFVNFDIEAELGKMGVAIRRSRSTFLSEWTKFAGFLNTLNAEKAELRDYAAPYLRRDVGGHGLESVGERVRLANAYDGVIHLAPFTCMPEVVAQNIMPSIPEGLPILTLHCDEQMGRAGVLTRIEAFVDLLERRRQASNGRPAQA
ncbi:MAG: hypothetical protein HYY01_00270 [Chloroflexi bacterium]|nr:hypothetical protein [Chloroflexota bacterium]